MSKQKQKRLTTIRKFYLEWLKKGGKVLKKTQYLKWIKINQDLKNQDKKTKKVVICNYVLPES